MTKIYYGRDLIGRFTCDGKNYTRFQLFLLKAKRLFKTSLKVVAMFCAIGWGMVAGATYFPRIDIVEAEVIKEVAVKAPVMDKIAQCESGNSHIDKKTGQVLMRANTNKTVDVGKYQINSVWYKKATELGYDITKEVDNEKMAYWLYYNRGTGDWVYSQKCWGNK